MIILSVILFILAVFTLGYACGHYVTTEEDAPQATQAQGASIIRRNKPINTMQEDIPSGPVQRPTIDMIKKWNEDPGVTQAKQAMSETFDADPELRKLKQEYTQLAKY